MTAARPATEGVVVRRAVKSDLANVAEIERRAFSDPWSAHAFEAALGRQEIRFTVAEWPAGGLPGVVGYLVAWFVGDEGEIANVAVDDRCRGRGLGAVLLDDVLVAARRAGVCDLYLEVRESNLAARRLYESRRFEETGRRRRYYRNPVEDALVLHRAVETAGAI